MELVEHLGKPLVFVVNGAAARARITTEAVTLLSQHGPLAPAIIHQRDRLQGGAPRRRRSEEHTSELQSLMRISYAVFCLKKKKKPHLHRISLLTQHIFEEQII